jgi:type IV secretion system protein TrbL
MSKPFALLIAGLAILALAVPGEALAANEATGLLDSFINQTSGWWNILRGYALTLFTLTLTIEVCLFGVRMALQQSQLGEVLGQFMTLLLFAGFVASVINNYQSWATGIAVTGLKPLVGELTGNNVDAGQPFAIAAAIVDKVMLVMADFGLSDIAEAFLYISSMLIIIVVFVLISALIIVTTCEFYVVANIGVLLIGLGGSRIFKDYAVNVMRYVLSVALKLFVLQLVVNIGFAMLSLSDLDASIGSTLDTVKFSDLFFLIGKALILLALAKVLPDTCAGIISGSSIGGGNPLVGLAKGAAAIAAGAVSGGAAMGGMVAASHAIAKADPSAGGLGAKTFGETLGGMATTMWNAHQQSSIAQKPNTMLNQLKSQANAAKLLSDGGAMSSAAASPAPSASQDQAAPSAPQSADMRGASASGWGKTVDMRTPPAAVTSRNNINDKDTTK